MVSSSKKIPFTAEHARAGQVHALVVGHAKGSVLQSVPEVRMRAGRGIEGDRYFSEVPYGNASRDLTLIANEALEELYQNCGLRLSAVEARRNVVTSGVCLEALIGRRFRLGSVWCIGIEPCPPCLKLEQMTYEGVLRGLARGGGLRAALVTDGVVRVGDPVVPLQ
jgi:MOSC domain-containing protein YiiM